MKKGMRKMWHHLTNMSIRTVLTLLLFPFFVLLIICCVFFYISGVKHYTALIKNNTLTVVEQSRDSLNQDINNIQEIAQNLLAERAFYTMESNINVGKTPIEPVDYLRLSTSFTNFLQHYSTYIESIGLYLSDNSIYTYKSNIGSDTGILRKIDITPYLGQENMIWVNNKDCVPDVTFGETSHFSLIRPIGTKESKVKGTFLIGVRDELFFNQIQNSRLTSHSSIVLIKGGREIITNTEDGFANNLVGILNETEMQEIEQKINQAKPEEILSFETQKYFIVYTPISIPNTGILAVIPTKEMYFGYQDFVHIFVFLIAASIFIFIILYFIIPRSFSRPVTHLLKQMEQIKSPSDEYEISIQGYREIKRIGDGINDLLDRIRGLNQSVQREMKAKQATQLQYLFAQINPHFLYNTLDCIKELCACNENEKAEDMLNQLVVFYRIGVSKGKSFITLEQELKHVSAYLSILQTRFEDFQYVIEAEKELTSCYVLRMILQPVVENAIYHGIRPFRTDGTITISVIKIGSCIEIHVKDDGGGIPENVLHRICQSLDEPICEYTEKSYGVYGLKNIQDRIQIAYGKEYKIRVDSQIDYGTDVIITIPFEEEHV